MFLVYDVKVWRFYDITKPTLRKPPNLTLFNFIRNHLTFRNIVSFLKKSFGFLYLCHSIDSYLLVHTTISGKRFTRYLHCANFIFGESNPKCPKDTESLCKLSILQ